jgi:hypothetical protein
MEFPEDIDVAAVSGMIDVLAERTGVTPDRLRQMGMAGWRARHRLADGLSGNAPDEKRPVDAARQRASPTARLPGWLRTWSSNSSPS